MSIKGVMLHPVKEQCPYLEDKISITENMLIREIGDEDLDILLSFGFRHFGDIFFRPMCGICRSCIPVRIPVRRFSPSKSVRRLFNRNKHFKVTIEEPAPSQETFELYTEHKKRFKNQFHESYDIYEKSFFYPLDFTFNRVLAVRDGDRLVALTHLDVTANAMSAIYCYFDENYKKYSPGKFSVYKEIEIARKLGIEWLYLGYYVPGNRHMKYKLDFKPNQWMVEDRKWIDFIDASGNMVNPLPIE
jgi:arginine-tRNA-protein transferase